MVPVLLAAFLALATAQPPAGWPTQSLVQHPVPTAWPADFWNQPPVSRVPVPIAQVPPEVVDVSQVSMVIVGVRNGNSNPEQLLPTDPNTGRWAQEGVKELTNIGKRQAYALGRALRQRYGHIINQQYVPEELRAYSSSEDRAQMTMETLLAGVYPPTGRSVWNPQLMWQPVPVVTRNEMLRADYDQVCPTAVTAWDPVLRENVPELQDWLTREAPFIKYVQEQNPGFQGTLRDVARIADNIYNLNMRGYQFPTWAQVPTLSPYTRDTIYQKLMGFRDVLSYACAQRPDCRKIMAGYWLNDIVDSLRYRQNRRDPSRRLVTYTTAIETIQSVMNLMNLDYTPYNYGTVPESGGFIVEYRDVPTPAVRVLYHEPTPGDPDSRRIVLGRQINPCPVDAQHWCPRESFLAPVTPYVIRDWRATCKVTGVSCPATAPVVASPVFDPNNPAGKKVTIIHSGDCSQEVDESPTSSCVQWALAGQCEKYRAVRYLFCRQTCLCNRNNLPVQVPTPWNRNNPNVVNGGVNPNPATGINPNHVAAAGVNPNPVVGGRANPSPTLWHP